MGQEGVLMASCHPKIECCLTTEHTHTHTHTHTHSSLYTHSRARTHTMHIENILTGRRISKANSFEPCYNALFGPFHMKSEEKREKIKTIKSKNFSATPPWENIIIITIIISNNFPTEYNCNNHNWQL